ncbi:MAG TPA: hypothetical protein VKR38_16890 [Usitatibacter sp.]|nr:hypothetical protein [Usitatibacter sp.]
MPLDIVVPDLLPAPDAPPAMRSVRLPNLERWLSRADLSVAETGGSHGWIAAEHGLGQAIPHAAICLAGEGVDTAGEWIRADPVHLRVDRDAVVLHDPAVLELTTGETASLVSSLREHFASDGLEWQAVSPERWYVRVPAGESPTTVPLERAFGRNVFGMLPRGRGRINWPSALTESQMTLSEHEVNAKRAPKPAANSVWFWGEGPRPANLERRYGIVHAVDPFSLGIARLSKAEAQPLPAGLEEIAPGNPTLLVVDSLTRWLRRGDALAWLVATVDLDGRWFDDLGSAIARHGTVRIILPGEDRTRVATLTSLSRWRWFRGRKAIAAHA